MRTVRKDDPLLDLDEVAQMFRIGKITKLTPEARAAMVEYIGVKADASTTDERVVWHYTAKRAARA